MLEIANTGNISDAVRRRRWQWIGHVLRKDRSSDCAVSLGWTPEGRRKHGRPKTTWRRMVEGERLGEAGPPGMQPGGQPQTGPDGGVMFMPCAPPGAERFKVKVRSDQQDGAIGRN